MLKFLIDTQLPPLLAEVLKDKGHDAIHTTDFVEGHLMDDAEIRKVAVLEARIIVTKDKDFFDYFLVKGIPPKLLLIETGNIKNKELLNILRKHIQNIEALFETSSVVVLKKDSLYSYQ